MPKTMGNFLEPTGSRADRNGFDVEPLQASTALPRNFSGVNPVHRGNAPGI